MEKEQEFQILFIFFTALISLSRCDSVIEGIEGNGVNLTFPYPCDSYKITLQRANGAPFYSSIASDNYDFTNYQQERFSVRNVGCSLYLEINPVIRDDEATYISQAYREGVTLRELIRIRLSIDYAPGKVSCVDSNKYSIANWVLLECTAPIGSLDGQIQCFQGTLALPPLNRLVQIGRILKQSIWVLQKYKHPVFCCSSLLDQPKDLCDCKDSVWDNDQRDGIIYVDPCPVTTPGIHVLVGTELTEYQRNNTEDNSQLPTSNVSFKEINTNKGTKKTYVVHVLLGVSIIINTSLAMVLAYRHVQKIKMIRKLTKMEKQKELCTNINQLMKQKRACESLEKDACLLTLNSNHSQTTNV